MKTIDIAAREYACSDKCLYVDFDPSKSAFEEGAKQVFKWVPVSEELPEQNEFLVQKKDDLLYTKKVLAKTDCGSVMDTARVLCIDGKWDWCPTIKDEVFVSWRLLEYE